MRTINFAHSTGAERSNDLVRSQTRSSIQGHGFQTIVSCGRNSAHNIYGSFMTTATPKSQRTVPRVAIIGAGPGGLTLARILHVHGLDAEVYEREAFASIRPQGGSLDMHPESGQYAIERAG